MSTLSKDKISQLKDRIAGRVVVAADPNYDEVRAIWNAMIDRRPAVFVQCANSADVAAALSFARETGLEISIRGAGHNIAGNSVNDDGLVIDFSNMTHVRVDPEKRRAYVEPGATLGDFDKAVQAHGLATPVGINSTTGIAGLTLGGGFGWLTRKHGLTIDNLVSANVITADGKDLKASQNENADLFWALRGGGGNFGIVTQFEFALHPVGPEILAGLIVFPAAQARQVFSKYREFMASAPEELNVWAVFRHAPPLPFLPEEVHGSEVLVLAVFYAGDIKEGEKIIQPMQSFGTPHGAHLGAQPYVDWQKALDPLLTPGARNYWKTHNFTDLSNDALDKIIAYAGNMPSEQCEIFIALISGAPNRVPADAMAYGNRDAKFVLNVHGRWDSPADDETCISWARAFYKASAPYASGGAYVNFMTDEEGDRVAAAYGSNYDRLVQIKNKYDPENLFHLNQNIKP
ncbi:MAG: FAD-binding oxidoreductase [Calditrichales bacterium]|nr:MAG: FAD-binding oxidoreductase [Calditrichales bacterium]